MTQALFERCSQGWQALRDQLDPVVRQAMAVKLRIIQEDPYERGERASLNLGHTLGHALEQASDFRIKHGEGVAIGTLAAARLAEQMGLAQAGLSATIEAALDRLGLPTHVPPGLGARAHPVCHDAGQKAPVGQAQAGVAHPHRRLPLGRRGR